MYTEVNYGFLTPTVSEYLTWVTFIINLYKTGFETMYVFNLCWFYVKTKPRCCVSPQTLPSRKTVRNKAKKEQRLLLE